MDEHETKSEVTVAAYILIGCCLIVGLWLVGLWLGYEIGKDIGRGMFG